ncbi:hypothetical protein IIO_06567 [Bacillus cereus VD115]|nr:hypothetical protein IIO_06567 [Bacillus cereus VD115]
MNLILYTFLMITITIGINVFWLYKGKILRLFKKRRRPRENKGK